jgi:pimeloyl-ACP methyl ester carboxylesterase
VTRSIASGVAGVVVVTAVLTGGAAAIGAATDDGATTGGSFTPEEVERGPCPDSRFECVTITVPRDHHHPDGQTWEVQYAILEATGEQLGTFVTITGGPGSGGVYSADSYTDYMSPLITEHYDIVFLNQRGSGPFRPLRCDEAAAELSRAPLDVAAPGAADRIESTLEGFVDACIDEGDIDVDDLPYYGTDQAAEDLELVRRHLGADQLALYGESYGTQFVQTYAAAHPDRVSVLIVDGVVDLTLDGGQWYDEAARAYDDALVRTLLACEDDELCAADAGTDDVVAAYDALAAELARGPIGYDLTLPDGSTEARELTLTDLEVAASGSVGSFSGRMQLLRALNAATNGNPVPLGRMALQYVYLDPETLEVVTDPSWSDALYYAVECQDYSFYADAGSPRERLEAWLADHVAGPNDELRLGNIALGDLPCLSWPAQPGSAERPAPITDPPYPTFVLTADTDPATPMASALRVFERLDDAYLIVLQDGPHVIFDWGYACVDDLVSNHLASGERPPTRITICDGDIIDPYVAIAPDTPVEVEALEADPDAAAVVIEEQVLNHVEYFLWYGDGTLEYGCDFGGTAVYEPGDARTTITLDACEWADGWPTSGVAELDAASGELTWIDLTVGG